MLVGTFGVHFMRVKRSVYLFHAAKDHSLYDNLSVVTFIFCHFPLIRENPVPALWHVYGKRISENAQYCTIFLYNVKRCFVYIYI